MGDGRPDVRTAGCNHDKSGESDIEFPERLLYETQMRYLPRLLEATVATALHLVSAVG